jgi:DHA2 family multidrug resistance protein
MIPLSQSILLSNYPEDKKTFATSIWVMTAVVGPIFGPILGGWLTDNYSWPWIFYINVPVGIFSVVVTSLMLTGRETPITKSPVDYVGLGLLVVGVGCLQVLLDQGNDLDWFNSNVIIALGVVAFVSLCYFVVWELTQSNPVVDLTLFAKRNFCFGVIAITLGFMVYFSNVVIFPLWLQTQMGYTPTWAGLASAPVGILPFLLAPLVGRYMHKFDLRWVVTFGFIVFAYTSFWQTNFFTQVSFKQLIEPRFVQGIGIACFFAPLITIIVSGLPPARLASALGLSNFFRILGGSFGTSLSVTLWDRREAFHQSRLVEQITDYNPISNETLNHLQALGFTGQKNMGVVDASVINQAFMLSTNDIFWLSGCIFVCLIAVIWCVKPPFTSSGAALIAD